MQGREQLPPETRARVTAIILAKNEAHQLAEAVQSVLWADEVLVVVDPSSTDGTQAAAQGLPSKVRVLIKDFGDFSTQRNWAIAQVATPWVFMLDADERPSPDLVGSALRALAAPSGANAYHVYRRNYMLGRFLRHGGQANDKVIRLFKRDLRYQARLVHEEVEGYGAIGRLEGFLDHHTFHDWDQYMKKMHSYVILAGRQAATEGAQCGLPTILFRPVARFLKQYVLRGGFLDGMPGLIYACLASYSVFFKYSVLWHLRHPAPMQDHQKQYLPP